MTTTIRQLNDIANWMLADKTTEIPEILQGVFFMDGNPFPDDCLTLQGAEWNASSLTLVVQVFAPFQWTFAPTDGGRRLLTFARFTKLTYDIQFDETLKSAQITLILFGQRLPKWIADLSMVQTSNSIDGSEWYRKNSWFMGLSNAWEYTLRKILHPNGQHTSKFNELEPKIPKEFLVIDRL